ncbi:MAG: TIM barrel protein [Candidatus Pacearchaeota archaeon]
MKGEYKIGGYRISDIYQGSYSSLSPPAMSEYITGGSLGITTDPRSANIIQEVSSKLSSGAKQIEIEAVSPEIFDSIPKQHFKEVNRMAKLTGVEVSLHGPVMDVAGMSQQGFSETSREAAERKVAETLIRSHELNPDGNITVNFHSAEGIPGSQLLPEEEIKKLKKEGIESTYKRMIVVEKETGKLIPIETEKKYYPGEEKIKEHVHTPEKSIEHLNHTQWENTLSQIEFNRIRAEEILKDIDPVSRGLYVNWVALSRNPKEVPDDVKEQLKNLNQKEMSQIKQIHAAATYTDQARKTLNGAFDKAWTNVKTKEEKEILENISKQYRKILGVEEEGRGNMRQFDPKTQSDAIFSLLDGLEKVRPEAYVKIEDFATEKSSQTFGNAAWQAYKKFKDKSPVLVIENPPAGFALSTGEDIARIVEASREKFKENAVKNGMSDKEAERTAEKFIGATWDVGHINMLRKYGYTDEEIVKETEKVAPYVKHVHLSDNFGFEHTELPMGMGNVPLKEMMEKLGQKGYDAKKIVEASVWWQHFKTSPFQESLEAMGSPIYGMKMAPYWNQAAGLYQGYLSGMEGQWLPQTNYETFGTTFSRLPKELGGSAQGAGGSRMSGRPME